MTDLTVVKRMSKLACVFLIFLATMAANAQHIESFGVFGGINFPVTIDQGLRDDPRYIQKFTLRGSPFGFHYGYDAIGYGFVVTPHYLRTGQSFIIQNTVGGEVGSREVLMDFISVPVAIKLHIADLAFLRVSLVGGINVQYLLNGREVISHSAAKLRYPATVAIPAEAGYEQVFDGVFVPEISNLEYVSKDQFKSLQLFAALGVRSDYDITEDLALNFDGRINYGLFEPRTSAYVNELKQTTDLPDLYGTRRDLHLSVTVGLSRSIEIKKKFKARRSTRLVGNKQFEKPKRRKPKN